MKYELPADHDVKDILALRDDIISSPVAVALYRARVFTRVWQENDGAPWIVLKGMALRAYFETVPLFIRTHDRLAGSISETPGAMPVFPELGIGENGIGCADRSQMLQRAAADANGARFSSGSGVALDDAHLYTPRDQG